MCPSSAANTHVRGLIVALQRLGWDVTLFAEVGDDHIRPGHLRQLYRYSRLQLALALRLRRGDIIYVRQHFASLPLVAFARLCAIPVVLELNGLPDDPAQSYPVLIRFQRMISSSYKYQFKFASHVFAVTEGLADFVRLQALTTQVSVTPNGADTDIFNADSKPRPIDAPPRKYVITYGDFAMWHNLNLIMEAARHPSWPQDVDVLIIGQGPAAKIPVVDRDLRDRVTWLERRDQNRLSAYIVNALAGIVPIGGYDSRLKLGVFPLKLVEMLACGVPVIVTELPGQSELVRENRCGFVVPVDGIHELAEAVAQLVNSPETCAEMGHRGRQLVEEKLSWGTIARQVHTELCALARVV